MRKLLIPQFLLGHQPRASAHSRVSGVSSPVGAVDRAQSVQPYLAALPRGQGESLECASSTEAEAACRGFEVSSLARTWGVTASVCKTSRA